MPTYKELLLTCGREGLLDWVAEVEALAFEQDFIIRMLLGHLAGHPMNPEDDEVIGEGLRVRWLYEGMTGLAPGGLWNTPK